MHPALRRTFQKCPLTSQIRKGVAAMATNNVETRRFSRDAVCCVLRGLVPTTHEVRRETEELKGFLQFNFHNVVTVCMHIARMEAYSGTVDAVSTWWLEVIASHQPSWKGGELIVTPAPEEALDFFLDNVVAQA